MRDFIETLRIRVPPEIHPSAQYAIGWWHIEMRDAMDDPAEVMRLAAKVRHRIVDELRWEAVKYASAYDYRQAYRLRRRADRYEGAVSDCVAAWCQSIK
jgi:hypothetical protein